MSQSTLPKSSAWSRRPKEQTAKTARRSSLIGQLPVGRKIALSSLLLIIPYLVVNYYLRDAVGRNLHTVESQLVGQQLLSPAATLLQNTQLVRLSSVNMLNGQSSFKDANSKQRAVISKAFADMLALTRENNLTELTTAITAAQKDMSALHTRVDATSLSAKDAQAAYSQYITDHLQPIFLNIAQETQLRASTSTFTNRGPVTAQLVPLIVDTLPQNLPNAGAIVSGNVQLINRLGGPGKPITEAGRIEAQLRWDRANEARQRILLGMNTAMAADPTLKSALQPSYNGLNSSSNAIFDRLKTSLLEAKTIQVDTATLNQLTPAYASGLFSSLETSIKSLGAVLALEKRDSQLAFTAVNTLPWLLLALFGWAFWLISQSITRPLNRLNTGARQLAEGNLTVNLPVTSADEIGQLSASFNSAAEQLRLNAERNEHERLESQKLQSNISEFLDVTMDIAEGDLTKRGKVTDDVLGNVVDSINLMTEELAQVLKSVQVTSESVTGGSQAVLQTTERITQGAQLTATETERAVRQMRDMTQEITQMAQKAQASADAARQALLASQQGQEAVQDTLGGMQNIRREVQGIAKRIKSLGDRSLEIQEIVDTISQIARQTHLLSLNASIEAAGAGEAGGRFSAVANEVRQLADVSNQATSRVATLIKNVQTEIQDVVVGIEEGTREVEQGYRVAGTAGERLKEIGSFVETSAGLAEQIAHSTQAQAKGTEQVSRAVQRIADIAEQAQDSVEQGRMAAEQLEGLAQQLNANLARFRLNA